MNFVLDIETIPRDLRAEPRKIQEYVWERVVRRTDPESRGPALDEFDAPTPDGLERHPRADPVRLRRL